jgi:aryl-alcohol dehydrogenase-like predicted oxidoreductase
MAELVEARLTARIASVQNRYNLISRQSEDVLDSPVMLPIPGTASVVHLEENIASAPVELTDEQFGALSTMS